MASSFKVPDIDEQPPTAYDDTGMEDNDGQQPSTPNANEMANNIIKEAQNALANQEEMTPTKKSISKRQGSSHCLKEKHISQSISQKKKPTIYQ